MMVPMKVSKPGMSFNACVWQVRWSGEGVGTDEVECDVDALPAEEGEGE